MAEQLVHISVLIRAERAHSSLGGHYNFISEPVDFF